MDQTSRQNHAGQDAASLAPPKVFISYSWSSPGHQQAVRRWAERLLQDGIDVILDIFDLKEGHDKYAFMEKMVTDPSVTHVLILCDGVYTEKANTRKSGVGTESQIISREVYERVEQSKFIPVVCEFSETGAPKLPQFLQSRIWIDFSSPEAVNENWEQLVRAIYGKPAHQKPTMGKPPTYILQQQLGVPADGLVWKFETFKRALLNDLKGIRAYRQDYLSACVDFAEAIRTRQEPEKSTFPAKILRDCAALKHTRDRIVDWVLFESEMSPSEDFTESLLQLLETLRELKSRPPEINAWNDSWFDAHSIFVYETFLYIIAALLKTASFGVLHQIFATHYLLPKSERYGNTTFGDFSGFYGCSEIIQSEVAPQGKRLYSPTAEILKRQADRRDLPFTEIIQAELLVFLMALITPDARWYPQTAFYASRSDFPLFLRAAQHRHFVKLAAITKIEDADVLRERVADGYERLHVDQWYDFASSFHSLLYYLKIDEFDSVP